MVEIKETRNDAKNTELAKMVDENLVRLSEMERRVALLQGHLAGLAPAVAPAPPPGPQPAFPPMTPEPPAFAYFGAPFGMPPLAMAGPMTQGFGMSPFPPPGSPFASGMAAPFGNTSNLSGADFERLPAVQRTPELNLVDSGEKYLLRLAVPGARKEDIELTVSERTIAVDAQTRPGVGQGTVVLGEFTPVTYRRTIPLPTACNSAKCKATLKDGFLNIEVPKKEPTEAPRRLDIAYG